MKDTKQIKPVGRPETGRELARYWIKKTTAAIIKERAAKAGCKREADYLEKHFAKA